VRVGSEIGEFHILTMASKNQQNEHAKKRRADELLSSSDEDESTYPRFLVVSTTNDSPIELSIFGIQKLLSCAIGDVKRAKKLRSGTVLIEVQSKKQADKALQMKTWIDKEVTVSAHRSLNTSRGIIRCREFRDCDDAEVLNALNTQGVTAVKRIMARKNGTLEKTNTFIVTFGLPVPPKSVRAAYMKIDVELFIPNPLRCYNCQKFGHGKSTCNRHAVCAKCSQEGHLDADCPNTPHCANCSGDHCSYSKDCQEWAKQKEISRIKFERNISFGDAKKVVEQNNTHPLAVKTYAQASAGQVMPVPTLTVSTPTRTMHNMETQTDLTWPFDSKVPHQVTAVSPGKCGYEKAEYIHGQAHLS